MNKPTNDDRNSAAIAMSLVTRITTGSFLLVLPTVLGYWLDQRYQTQILFLLVGFGLGMVIAGRHLWLIICDLERKESSGQ